MGKWIAHFKVKDLLSEDDSDENAEKVAEELRRRIQDSPLFKGTSFADDLMFADDVDAVNDILSDIYDYADEKRIWID